MLVLRLCTCDRLEPSCAILANASKERDLSTVLDSECSRISTHRERRLCVLMLLANGYSSKEIAAMLDGTKRGIDNDVGWWQDRLDARSRSQVAAIAVARGILSADDLCFDGSETMLAHFRNRHVNATLPSELGDRLWRTLYRLTSSSLP